jgi:hypothetical protein
MPRILRTLFLVSCCLMSGALSAQSTAPPKAPDSIAIDGETFQLAHWQLPPEQFVAAKMPIRLVHPRPDSETNSWARHRKAYPGLEYRIPVSVQGGAYPFYYEIIQGPSGMTVGQQIGAADYGILRWTPPGSSGPQTVEVRVTDQEMNSVTARFTLTATTEGFVFIDPKVASNGDGTINSPLRDFWLIHGDGDADYNKYAGYIAYLRDGTHRVANTGGWFPMSANSPMVVLGYPGEAPVINSRNGYISVRSRNGPGDFFFSGIKLKDSNPDRENSRFFSVGGTAGYRSTFFELSFEGHVAGTVGNDNAHHIHFAAQDGWTEYVTFWGLEFRDQASKGSSIGSTYQTRYVVVENNLFGAAKAGFTPNAAVFMKQESTMWSLRRNISLVQGFRSGTLLQYASDRKSPPQPQLAEMCYNLLRSGEGGTVITTARATSGATAENPAGNPGNTTWVYRNTILGRVNGTDRRYNTMVFEANVYLTDSEYYEDDAGGRVVIVAGNDLTGKSSDIGSVLDGEYRLKGSHRSSFLGKRGHEIPN